MGFAVDDLGGFAGWEQSMTTFPAALAYPRYPTCLPNSDDHYDSPLCFRNVWQWTGDVTWADKASIAANRWCGYIIPAGFMIPGYYHGTRGLAFHYLDTGDPQSRAAAIGCSAYAAYAATSNGGEREMAWAVLSHLTAEDLGRAHREIIHQQVDRLLFLISTAIDDPPGSRPPERYVQAFMLGLACEALIAYWDRYRDERLPGRIQAACDWLWENMWVPEAGAFLYADRDTADVGRYPVPALNLLIGPTYAWLYRETGDQKYREQHDAAFNGSSAAKNNLGSQKEWNQAYRWSCQGMKWRAHGDQQPPLATELRIRTYSVDCRVNAWSDRFFIEIPEGTRLDSPVVVTPHDNRGGGTFMPTSSVVTTDHPSAVFRYRPAGAGGTRSLDCTNNGGLKNIVRTVFWCRSIAPVAMSYAVIEPRSGPVGQPLDLAIALQPTNGAPPASSDAMGGVVFIQQAGTYNGADGGFLIADLQDKFGHGGFNRFHVSGDEPIKELTYTPSQPGERKLRLIDRDEWGVTGGLEDPQEYRYRAK